MADASPFPDAGDALVILDGPPTVPDGALPDGALPDGALPDGALLDGALPDGALPSDGALPDGALPDVALPSDGAPPDLAADASVLPPDAAGPPAAPRTEIGPAGRLRLLAGLPAHCGEDCDDTDADGLSDAWEAVALDRLRPRLVFDEEESVVNDDPGAVVAFVGRVAPAADDPAHVRVFLMIGYTRDYGRCGLTAHNGDSERVVIDLAALPSGPGDFEVLGLYTAAHENTISDSSHRYRGDDLVEQAVFTPDESGEPRWTVFPAGDKHGTYINVDVCESVSIIPCFDEDCGPDGVDAERLPDYTRLPPVFDAGEPDAPRLEDLGPAGFPGEQAWVDQDFCGGLARGGCASSVLSKLTDDPFVE